MMNPEFRRNLWLSFSRHKLIAMPALLGLGFLALAISEKNPERVPETLYTVAVSAFIFIVWLWGARNANLCIVDELRDKTWDQQRMSALNPWAMTWGKLLGSTSFNWYGGAFCLVVAALAGIASGKPWELDLPILVAASLMLHASLIALNLHTGQLEMALIQRGGLGWIAIIAALVTFQVILNIPALDREMTWWGFAIRGRLFLLASVTLFGACAVFSAWRVVSNALQVRTVPWAWPLLASILTVYFAGLSRLAADSPLFVIIQAGVSVAALMTYSTLFTEPARLPDWNRLRLRQQKGDWHGWLQHLPMWPTTLLLAFVFALVAALPLTHPTVKYGMLAAPYLHAPLSLALMLLRDACIVLFFSFSPRAKRPAAVAILYLIVLDGLLPFFFREAGLDAVAFFFLPFDEKYSAAAGMLAMASQAVIALGLVAWRLQKSKPAVA